MGITNPLKQEAGIANPLKQGNGDCKSPQTENIIVTKRKIKKNEKV